MKLLTTVEAGRRLGVSGRRVRVLLAEGRIKAMRVGGRWLVDEGDLIYERKRRGPKTTKKEGNHERPHNQEVQG